MIVTHNITIDLTNPKNHTPRLEMVQGDTNTRAVAIALTAEGAAYTVPAGSTAVVRYRKTDGTGGVYDTLPDGTAACTVGGSTVTVLLAPQVLSCPGMAWVSVALSEGTDLLGIFNFSIHVQADPSIGTAASENYFSYDSMAQINTALAQALAAANNVDAKIAGALADLSQLEANFVNSLEECTDTGKVYILPDGYIYAYLASTGKGEYVNYLLLSEDENGDPYNGGLGWKADTRLNSSGAEASAAGTEVTGFIPLTKGDVLRFENMKITGVEGSGNTTQYMVFYNSAKAKIKHVYTHDVYSTSNQAGYLVLDSDNYWQTYDTGNLQALDTAVDWSDLAYFRISAEEITEDSMIIINGESTGGETTYSWKSTDHAFVPTDYEDRILALEETIGGYDAAIADAEQRLTAQETAYGSVILPDYWRSHCDEKVSAIQTAMENAGRNKSAFLWYTDSHWAYGAQMAPAILKYLHFHTAMNKVNFGGDIVDDYAVSAEDCMEGLRQWRLAVRDLPNHHSVIGNHDDDITELATNPQRYGFLMAAEENGSIVRGGDFYYYIDEPSEKTRYLYLDTSMCVSLEAQGDADAVRFVVDALSSTPAGWHIVVISHIWFLYADTSTPTVGEVPDYCKILLTLFDQYNIRSSTTQTVGGSTITADFADAKGKVEFCIGGHTHVDYDFVSGQGIPIILTETDSFHSRSGLVNTKGTTAEASVSAIIADYDNGKISVIRIGRGEDRVITI